MVYCQCHKSLMLAGRDMCVTKKSQKRLSGWNLTLSATYCNYIVTPVKSEIFMKNIWYIICKPEGIEPWFKLVLIPHRLLRCAKKWAMNLMFIKKSEILDLELPSWYIFAKVKYLVPRAVPRQTKTPEMSGFNLHRKQHYSFYEILFHKRNSIVFGVS